MTYELISFRNVEINRKASEGPLENFQQYVRVCVCVCVCVYLLDGLS